MTLSLPAVIGRGGVSKILTPALSAEESSALAKSGEAIAEAFAMVKVGKMAWGLAKLTPRSRNPAMVGAVSALTCSASG